MSGLPTAPELRRAHLEALLIARAALEQPIGDVDRTRLSPAANALLAEIGEWPTIAAEILESFPRDEFQDRLAQRAARLTVQELGFFSRRTLVALVNQLPVLEHRRSVAA